MTHLTKRQQQVLAAIVKQGSTRKEMGGTWIVTDPVALNPQWLRFSASTLYTLIDAGLAVLTEATKAVATPKGEALAKLLDSSTDALTAVK